MQDQNKEYHVEDYMEEVCDMEALEPEGLEAEALDVEEENLENYFRYIEGLSRSDLIILLEWEIQNRMAMTESMSDMEATIIKLECAK
jgi:hypothetical protein